MKYMTIYIQYFVWFSISIHREPTESDEFILCTIKFDANGVISIRPDFNKGRKAYKIEAAGIGRGMNFSFFSLRHSNFHL